MSNEIVAVADKSNLPIIAPKTLDEVMKFSDFLSKSQLIPNGLRGKPQDIAVVLMSGAELGVGPMQALQNISAVNGKPCTETQLQLALIMSRCPEAEIVYEKSTDQEAIVLMKRGKNWFRSVWNMDRARKLGLDQKPNYRSQPATMLKWRAASEAARTLFPDIVKGLYTKEEAEDIVEPQTSAKVETLKTVLNEPPVIETTATSVEAEPVVEPTMEPSQPEDLGLTVIEVGGQNSPIKGKTFAEVGKDLLMEEAKKAHEWFTKGKIQMGPKWVDFFDKVERYCQ